MKVTKTYDVPEGKLCCLKLYPNGVIGKGICEKFRQDCYVGTFCGLFGGLLSLNEKGEPSKCESCLKAEKEVKKVKAQIEKMKCCGNCANYGSKCCGMSLECKNYSAWKLEVKG